MIWIVKGEWDWMDEMKMRSVELRLRVKKKDVQFDWMMEVQLWLLSRLIVRHETLLLPCSCLISAQISL